MPISKKNCPFCGSNISILERPKKMWGHVQCWNCHSDVELVFSKKIIFLSYFLMTSLLILVVYNLRNLNIVYYQLFGATLIGGAVLGICWSGTFVGAKGNRLGRLSRLIGSLIFLGLFAAALPTLALWGWITLTK